MSNKLKIFCENTKEYIDFNGGETLLDVYNRALAGRIGFQPVCARVNYKTEDLRYPLFSPKMVEFLPRESASGSRTYVRSLCMLLYKAVAKLLPGTTLRIEHSVSRGYYCRLSGNEASSPETVESLRREMRRLVKADIAFERKERLSTDVSAIFARQGLDDKVRLLASLHELYTVYYRLGDICDSYYGQLVPSTSYLDVFDLRPYKGGMLLLPFNPENPSEPAAPSVQEKLFAAFTDYVAFNHIVGVSNAGELNEAVEKGESAMLINVSEALHNKRISTIADEITARFRSGGAKVVLIAGPSSSGKTTFTKRLAIQLMTNLIEPVMISLDDYFIDRHRTPLDEHGELDYESLYALDIPLFNTHLNELLSGGEIDMPTYNFAKGEREYRGRKLRLGSGSVLLIEGIHGLNPELTASVEASMKYHIYVSALTTISIDDHNWVPTTDNRLLRRIIRDHKYRGTSAVNTIRRWPSVRRGEEKWIFPYQENADSMFNSSLLFELGVLKERGEEILSRVPRDVPEFGEASRLRKFLSYFAAIDEEFVPSTSLVREFIGGSSFNY